MNDYDTLLKSIRGIAQGLQSLNRRAVQEYAPIIEGIIRSRSRDTNYIEHTLDGLLGFCGYEPALVLFKRLCRYYWEIDRDATAWHINSYREMWDSEENGEDEDKLKTRKKKVTTRRPKSRSAG